MRLRGNRFPSFDFGLRSGDRGFARGLWSRRHLRLRLRALGLLRIGRGRFRVCRNRDIGLHCEVVGEAALLELSDRHDHGLRVELLVNVARVAAAVHHNERGLAVLLDHDTAVEVENDERVIPGLIFQIRPLANSDNRYAPGMSDGFVRHRESTTVPGLGANQNQDTVAPVVGLDQEFPVLALGFADVGLIKQAVGIDLGPTLKGETDEVEPAP